MSYITYTDIEFLIIKIDGCANNPEKLSTAKIDEHILSGYSMSTGWVCDHIENKQNLYRGKDCMKRFCESLREHAKSLIGFEKKKMLPLTKEELKSGEDAKVCYIYKKKSQKSSLKAKIIEKLEIIVIIQVNIEAQHIVFVIQNFIC